MSVTHKNTRQLWLWLQKLFQAFILKWCQLYPKQQHILKYNNNTIHWFSWQVQLLLGDEFLENERLLSEIFFETKNLIDLFLQIK
jgi:hypothetical protein